MNLKTQTPKGKSPRSNSLRLKIIGRPHRFMDICLSELVWLELVAEDVVVATDCHHEHSNKDRHSVVGKGN
jgi:hypothetical protein